MSYILEALKRADAERDRGALPTLRSPGPGLAADVEPVAGGKPWLWLLVGLLIAVIAMLVWRQWAPGAVPAPVVATAPQAPANPPAGTVADSVTATTAPPVASSVAVPPKEAAPNPTVAPSRAAPPTRTAAATAPSAKRPAVPPTPTESSRTTARAQPETNDDADPKTPPRRSAKASPSPATAPAPPAPPKPAEPATPPARIYAVSELPEDIRRSLPKLAIGGSVYSESAGSRMLIVNGQIFHESDTLVPGLKLEQIRLKEAVMNFRGYRYEVSY